MGEMIVLGITGSIGMGKSTASLMLREMGIPVHDADAAVHALLSANGKAVALVNEAFPGTLKADNSIDRQLLGRIVFGDAAKRQKLEDILHPMVRAESDAFVAEMAKKNHKIIALDIPLLFETKGENRVQAIICVTASSHVQKERVLIRPGMTPENFERILAGQMPDAEKRKRAHYVVDTDKGFDDVKRQLHAIISSLQNGQKPPKISP